MTFANQLKQARHAAGLSQAALARKLGVTTTTVRNWEHGRTEPPKKRVLTQAEVLAEICGND